MKYSTPSIEVVTFNPSDAPRIGMQWFYALARGSQWTAVPAGVNYTGPHTISYQNTLDATGENINCPSVTYYRCGAEEMLPADAFVYNGDRWVLDDGRQSC